MATNSMVVFGLFPSRTSFEYALAALKVAGFYATEISVLSLEEMKDFERQPQNDAAQGNAENDTRESARTTVGWLMESRSVAIQGRGPLLISGPLVAALSNLRSLEGLTGVLLDLGVPEREAKQYPGRINRGGILLSVHCIDPVRIEIAKNSLRTVGAEDLCSTSGPTGRV